MRRVEGEVNEEGRIFLCPSRMFNDPLLRCSGPKVGRITFVERSTDLGPVPPHLFCPAVQTFFRIMLVTIHMSHIAEEVVEPSVQRMRRPAHGILRPTL